MSFKCLLRAVAMFAFCYGAAHATSVYQFNFDTDTPGTTTAFTDVSGPVSATFTSSADPGGFVIYPSLFETLTGNVLGDPGPSGASNISLDIAFNKNLAAITLNFATADFTTPSPLTIAAYENSTMVGSTTLAGQFLPGFSFPEGEIAFDSGKFNNVVISSMTPDFAVDNVALTTSSVPEPGTIGMLIAALFLTGVGAARRRKPAHR